MPQVIFYYSGRNPITQARIDEIIGTHHVYASASTGNGHDKTIEVQIIGTDGSGLECALNQLISIAGVPLKVGQGSDYNTAKRVLGQYGLELKGSIFSFLFGKKVVAKK